VSAKWEVITEEELNANKGGEAGKDNPDFSDSQMIKKILFLTCLAVIMRGEMFILIARTTVGMILSRSDNQDDLDPHFFAGCLIQS
jgi:hypothetical protein